MLQGGSRITSQSAVGEPKRYSEKRSTSTRGLKDTLQISRCRQIENAINASKVVARDLGPVDIHLSEITAPTRNSIEANESTVFS